MPKRRNRTDYAGARYATQKTPIKASGNDKSLLKKYMADPEKKKKMRDLQEKALKRRRKANA